MAVRPASGVDRVGIHLAVERMAELPSIDDLIRILQTCRKYKNLAHAKRVHAHICDNGLESHRALGNHIVSMLAECGSVSDAQQVFNRLGYRNVHSWTSLMLGYIECGKSQHALNLYQQMQEDSVPPSSYTLMTLLKACARLKDVERGREIHVEISQKGFESDIFVGSTLVDMYAKCGSLAAAQEVFDKLRLRNVVSWTALISGYSEHGPGQEALKCFEQMQLEGIYPDAVSFLCALKACSSLGAINKGREIHMGIMQNGFEKDVFIGNTLVDMYARCGSVAEARGIFEGLPVRDVVSWNALIAGYAEHGPCQEAIKCFEEMQLGGISSNALTFMSVLKACGSIRAIDKGRKIHTDIRVKGLERDVFVGNTLVDMYAKCGSLVEAREIFDSLPSQNVVSWNAIIAGYAEHGPFEEALKCLEQMQREGVSPDDVTFVSVLKAFGSRGDLRECREMHAEIAQKGLQKDVFVGSALVDMYAKCGSLVEAREAFDQLPVRNVVSWNALVGGYAEHGLGQEALKCLEEMQFEGLSPDAVTFVCALKACRSLGAIDMGRKMHAEIAEKGLEAGIVVGSTLVDMYAKCGSVLEAQEVFDKLPVQNVVSWNALIAGYAEHGPGQEALNCFEQMQLEGVSPGAVTYVCVLKACGSIGAIDRGREIQADLAQKGFERDLSIGNTLVDMYAKCGCLVEAREAFDNLFIRDVVSWNAMIIGYGLNQEGNMAIRCFKDMQEQGVKPNDITFACLLTACSRARMVLKGQELFNVMTEEYGIAPTIDHYTCMVDLLAKSGHLYEAERFLESMPCRPLWTALLSACIIYGEVELGLRCFQQLVQMNPECAAPYVLMSRVYATAGRWDDAYRIEELRKRTGANKKLASAFIEVNNKMHEFVVGNNQSKEISAMLENLSLRMKVEGHVPSVNLVLRSISDEEKETTLCEHAEKFAIAFGTSQYTTGTDTLC